MDARITPLTFALALALVALPQLAAAAEEPQPPQQAKVDEAKGHYRRARELYDENNFRAALVEMQRAYDLSGSSALLFDLGQIQYQLQEYPGALTAFTKYLASNKGDITPARIDEVQKDIERLKARIGSLRISSNKPGAQILVDDVVVGTAPLAEPGAIEQRGPARRQARRGRGGVGAVGHHRRARRGDGRDRGDRAEQEPRAHLRSGHGGDIPSADRRRPQQHEDDGAGD